MLQNPEFQVNQQQWNDGRTAMYGGFYVESEVQERLYEFAPLWSRFQIDPRFGPWFHDLTSAGPLTE